MPKIGHSEPFSRVLPPLPCEKSTQDKNFAFSTYILLAMAKTLPYTPSLHQCPPITSGPASITILVPNGEIAVVSLAGSNYQIADVSGIAGASSGGSIVGNTFTASDPASGQNPFTVNDGTNTGTVQLFGGAPNIIP